MITVSKLIEMLKQFDGDTPVLLYDAAEESSSVVCDVELETEETQNYTNGDHAFFYNRYLKKNKIAVTIVGKGLC